MKQYSKFDSEKSKIKRVYLDQKDWIELARGYHEKENSERKKIANYILKLADSNKYIFPISFTHLIETLNCLSDKPRKSLLDYIIKVSKGNYITHYVKFVESEIYYSLLAIEKGLFHDIRNFVFTKSHVNLVGAEGFSLTEKDSGKNASSEVYRIVEEAINDPNNLRIIMKESPDQKNIDEVKKSEEENLKEIQNEIEWIKKVPKEHKHNVALLRFWFKYVIPKIGIFLKRYNLDHKTINQENIKDQMKLVCSQYVLANLLALREKDQSKAISVNDLNDIDFLAMVIPYADFVTLDKRYYGYVKSLKLDSLYKTIVVRDIFQLYEQLISPDNS